jgi:hypothetical protein
LGNFVCLNSAKAIVNARDVLDADRSLFYPSMVVSSIDQIRTIVVMSTASEFDLVRLPDGDDVKNTVADGRWCWVLAKGVSLMEVQHVGDEFNMGDYIVSVGAWLGHVMQVRF